MFSRGQTANVNGTTVMANGEWLIDELV